MIITTQDYQITWEKLPDDYILPDDPVDNIYQPTQAAALTESLQLAGKLAANCLITTNYGICATVNGKIVVKAPDWAYIPEIRTTKQEIFRSYTPQLQGDIPVIVMEFISDTDGTEYSSKPTYPPGKWFFYERILKVPNYIIFEPDRGDLEVYRLDKNSEQYQIETPDQNQRYWIEEIKLYLGIWEGTRENLTTKWLRFWDEQGNLLLWSSELVEQKRQEIEVEKQRAEQEKQRVERLAAQLRAAGIEPEN
ncbi:MULTISPECIES: Uma2 family endonuclease [unclassified Sphaerospermopsis]|uniref:Uma2 family endonuclease n=1 Tax=unclassified Sphaerospermopsis TaxID=2646443 RepID=UPI0016812BE6|nr:MULTISPECIES: Uma2 family endonuclease [unclassified Sphaerospermopsis]MBD2135659.1 Uma2 family endonuclease [Sphaerospermopsis sp. FACHB-1094]MBD2145183.1 Uma2 family endonuclease [Sphaerospermopsis sp. FACHB-1194]